MYQTDYEHENNINYMILISDCVTEENYQIKMLRKNTLKCILPISTRNINNTQYYYYNITSKQQISKLYEITKLKWEDVKQICISIDLLIKVINEYMLDLDAIILKPEYMYIDMLTRRVSFTYYPAEMQDFNQMLKDLFEYIIEHFDHASEKREILKVYSLYQNVNNGETDMMKLIDLSECDEKETLAVADEETENECKNNLECEIDSYLKYNNENKWNHINKDNINSLKSGQDEYKHNRKEDFYTKRSHVKSEERHGKEINVIPKEDIVEESEVPDKGKVLILQIIRAIGLLAVFVGTIEIFVPQYAIFHIKLPLCIVFIAGGILLSIEANKKLKKKPFYTKMKYTTKKQSYVIDDNDMEQLHKKDKKDEKYEKNEKYEKYEKRNSGKGKIYQVNHDLSTEENVVAIDETPNTVLLSEYLSQSEQKKMHQIYLIPEENEQDMEQTHREDLVQAHNRICVSKFPCIIGSMQGYCDIVIVDKLVSRMHLCIRQLQDGWYLEDMNSTNGTFINGSRIKPNQQLKIQDQDRIRLAAAAYKVEIS